MYEEIQITKSQEWTKLQNFIFITISQAIPHSPRPYSTAGE